MLNVVVVRSSSSAPEAGGIWVLKAQIDVHPVSDSVLHFFSGLCGGEALCFLLLLLLLSTCARFSYFETLGNVAKARNKT